MKNRNQLAFAEEYIDRLGAVLQHLPMDDLARALSTLETAIAEGRQIFLAGNGGSAATAAHMANDLSRGIVRGDKPGIRAISLTSNVSLITAIANDESYSEVFAVQLFTLGQPRDLLIVFSGSGNSPNIVRATQVARQMKITSIAFLGRGGGQVANMADISVIVPSDEYGPIEDVHMTFGHLVTAYLRSWLAHGSQSEG